MQITLLGTDAPTPSRKRMSSGDLMRVGNDVLLFDHGPGTYRRMREQILREMGQRYAGNLYFGEDLMQIPLDGPAPSKLV